MTRLDGEKKSPLPWIIGLIVLVLLAAGIYYFASANKGPKPIAVDENSVEMPPPLPPEPGVDNSADANAATSNLADANAVDSNMADANAVSSDRPIVGGVDSNAMDSNAVAANSPENGSLPPESVSGLPVPPVVPSKTPVSTKPATGADGTVATRSKTIKTDDKTVTYKKSVKEDGSLVRDKKIVPKPVEEAKKQQ